MDRSDVAKLIKKTYSPDAMLQQVPTESERTIFCNIKSVGFKEWAASGEEGLRPELMLTMFAPEYEGEDIVEVNHFGTWARYSVYRTYLKAEFEELELYLARKVGTAQGA